MAVNQVGGSSLFNTARPQTTQKSADKEKPEVPSMRSLIAAEIGDKFRLNPTGEQIKVAKGDETGYWNALGYMA